MRKKRSELTSEELEKQRAYQRAVYRRRREFFLAEKRLKYATDEDFREAQKARVHNLYIKGMEEIFQKRADERGYRDLFDASAKKPQIDLLEIALSRRDEELHEDPNHLTGDFLKGLIRSRKRKR